MNHWATRLLAGVAVVGASSAAAAGSTGTYSIVARDAKTGELGVAVQSHRFQVGALVPWAKAGVGAVATQALTNPAFGPEALKLLAQGKPPAETVDALLGADDDPTRRQIAVIDARGEVAVRTGAHCIPHKGHQTGDGYSVQANLVAAPGVPAAMATAFEAAEGPLAERMLVALRAAQGAEGDARGMQSSALRVVPGAATGDASRDGGIDLRVADHPTPLDELARLLRLRRAYDASLAGEYERARALAPDRSELRFWRGVEELRAGRQAEGVALLRPLLAYDRRWRGVFRSLPASELLSEEVVRLTLAAADDHADRLPNIVLILADDLGYGDVGAYGQTRIKTPHLDRMAAEGMRFTDFYSGSTVCAPARCTLITGRHTGHCRVRGNGGTPLRGRDVTLAEVLKAADYDTAFIGKWGLGLQHTGGAPWKQGFDHSYGFLSQVKAHDYFPKRLWRDGETVELPGNRRSQKGDYVQDLFTDDAIRYIKARREAPFFLYLAYTIPHAHNELGRLAGNGMEVPDDAPYGHEHWPQPQKDRAAMITRLDADVGKILAALDGAGRSEDTLVLFMSDNGPASSGGADPKFLDSAGALRGIKRDLYEGGIRVPMVARWPGRIPAGAVSDLVWANWDILRTLTDLTGAPTPPRADGVSVLPTLLGRPADQVPHKFLYWEFHERGFTQAVRFGRWKGVRRRRASAPVELYDLSVDMAERRDVAARHPDVVRKIKRFMRKAHRPSKVRRWRWR